MKCVFAGSFRNMSTRHPAEYLNIKACAAAIPCVHKDGREREQARRKAGGEANPHFMHTAKRISVK